MAEQTAYGGFWIRFLALAVDSAIIYAASFIILGAALFGLGVVGLVPAFLVVMLIYLLYWPVMQASARQATFGKVLLGLKVTDYSGARISLLRSFGRELAKIISGAVFMVGYLIAAFTGRKQALHDLMASTYVVREGPARLVPALALAVAGFAVPFVAETVLGNMGTEIMTAMMGEMMGEAAKPAPAPKPAPGVVVPLKPVTSPAPKAGPAPEAPKAALAPVAAVAPTPSVAQPPKPVIVEAPKPAVVESPKSAPRVRVAAVKPAPAPSPVRDETPRAAPTPRAAAPAPVARASTPGPKYNDLMTAVLYRDAAAVNELIAFGRWPDKPDSQGVTPLMAAARLGDTTNAEALLKAGANPDAAMPIARERRDSAMTALLERFATSRRP